MKAEEIKVGMVVQVEGHIMCEGYLVRSIDLPFIRLRHLGYASDSRWDTRTSKFVQLRDDMLTDQERTELLKIRGFSPPAPKRRVEEWPVFEQLDELMIQHLNGRCTAIDLVGRFPRFRYFVYRLPNGERYCDDLPRVHWDKMFNMITSVQCADENPDGCEVLHPIAVSMDVEGE